MSGIDLPLSEPVRLHQVGTGVTRTLEPDAAARARIAKALDLASLEAFTAEMTLAPVPGGWRLSGRVKASLAQTCGITLDPLPVEVDAPFSITLAEASDEDTDEIVITLDDESPDPVEGGQVDLGLYAVEQLALRLDPFPRKPGAEFVQPPEPTEISPFAVLKSLRPTDDG
ncbi:DUF177 domain-containing protein [Brevundimonas basaltis]|uniref:Uncharacterized metal-binding protein YceD (DUF177 family) n=1 Tax=Brevundimonas basaltis TaxID=472166 RepID=A0A7W8HW12_9CAUL|nr:DUF177 domain-containing protein [Brevundimonas basaltis]MBB5290921.1 uncharacterized metal-binding protein YceD (DUF177 family) [Brevundimonas basaltis]